MIGISARNGIMLVSHYRHLEQVEGIPFGRDLVDPWLGGALGPYPHDRSGYGPGARADRAGWNRAGYEIEHPLAVVILGGLVTSTLLNLFIVPALYFGGSHARRIRDSRRMTAPLLCGTRAPAMAG